MAAEWRRSAAGASSLRVEVRLVRQVSEAGLDTLPHAAVPVPVTSIKTKQIPIWFLLSLCVSATAWLYAHRILGPWTEAKDLQADGLKAQIGDLYPRWVGTRELLIHGRNPYSPDVSHEILGRVVIQDETSGRVIDEQRFVYPIYVVFLMAPTIYMDFATVQFWAPFVLGAFAVVTVLSSVGTLDWHVPWTTGAALILFTLSSPQIVQGMRHQQLALVVVCLLTSSAWFVHKGHFGAAGILLAFSTIKPQMALLPLVWFILWAGGEWRIRWRLLVGFGATLMLLIGAGELLVAGWLWDFFAAMAAYRRYFPTSSLLRLLLGDRIGIAVSCIIVIWLLVFGWKNRKTNCDSWEFAWVFAAFLMGTVLAFPLFTPFNQALLILPAIMLVREWAAIPRLGQIVFIAFMSWPWVISIAILLSRPSLRATNQLPLLPDLAEIAVPLLLPVLLFMRRTRSGALSGAEQST